MIKKILFFAPDLLLIFGNLILLLLFRILNQGVGFTITIVFFLMFLVPGYLLLGILYPKKCFSLKMDLVFSSFGLSVVVNSLLFLILGYSVGITVESVLLSLIIYIIIASVLIVIRRLYNTKNNFYAISNPLKNFSRMDWLRVLSGVIIVIAMVFLIALPSRNENHYTEFYMLGNDMKAGNYVNSVDKSNEAKIIFRVVSHESSKVEYKVFQRESDDNIKCVKTFYLHPGESIEWESSLYFSNLPLASKISFELYKDIQTEPYRSLYIWFRK